VRARRLVTRDSDERLAWLIVIATIPVGITGLALEHVFRTVFAKPLAAAIFLTINGVVLLAGERLRRRTEEDERLADVAEAPRHAGGIRTAEDVASDVAADRRLARLPYGHALSIGVLQILALLPGISRSGITMVGGLWRGLSHEDSARFAFLLATPVILAAGVLKLPSLAGPAGDHIHGQVVAGVIVTAVVAYLSLRFLVRWFETRTLTPFAIYCLIAGAASVIRFAV
jgi:undecaprenyl-diphosphatase